MANDTGTGNARNSDESVASNAQEDYNDLTDELYIPTGDADTVDSHSEVGDLKEEREIWGSKFSYLLTLTGYSVGLGNVWRFPYLLHSNGGLAFLIPYFFMMAFVGIPLFFLELAIGQRLKKGPLGCWNEISPYLGGVGVTCGLICYFVALYYNTLIAWVLSYLFDSFKETLLWTDCERLGKNPIKTRQTEPLVLDEWDKNVPQECLVSQQATKYYWFRRTLDISDSVTDPGDFNGSLLCYLVIAWLIIWAILFKGLHVSGKVVYVTAIFPYFSLLCFFFGNFWLPGYENGLTILLKPDFSVLLKSGTWLVAGTQVLFTLGVGYGCLTAFASYNSSSNNCHKDTIIIAIVNMITSLLAAIVIFPVLGFQGTREYGICLRSRKFELLELLGKLPFNINSNGTAFDILDKEYLLIDSEVDVGPITMFMDNGKKFTLETPFMPSKTHCNLETEVRDSGGGPGLVFIAFAEAAVHLPCPQFWCFLFFFMLLTLAIDSGFGTVEGAIAVLTDTKLFNWPRWQLTTLVCGSSLSISLVFAWGWGLYIQVVLDTFVANWGLLVVTFFELVGISWVYGLAKFTYDIKLMTGSKPDLFMLICWKYVSPFLLVVIALASAVEQILEGHDYERYDKNIGRTAKTPYPSGIIALGFFLRIFVIIWIPLQAILKYFGKSILLEETPIFFPENDLRAEHNITDANEVLHFGRFDRMVMGKKKVNKFMASRDKQNTTSSFTTAIDDLEQERQHSQGSTLTPAPRSSGQAFPYVYYTFVLVTGLGIDLALIFRLKSRFLTTL